MTKVKSSNLEPFYIRKIVEKYSESEAISALNRRIKQLELENGILKSDNSELIDQKGKGGVKQWTRDEYVLELKGIIKRYSKSTKEAKLDAKNWRDKYFSLLATSKNRII